MAEALVATLPKCPTCAIVGAFVEVNSLTGMVSNDSILLGNLATAYVTGAKPYEGDYEITPTVDGQKLETKQKYMTDDVTILAIPFFEVGNTSGGNTVYIANEIEME